MLPDSPLHLPANLPVPQDDGRTDHLTGALLPDITLTLTQGSACAAHWPNPFPLSSLRHDPRTFVLFLYPRTGIPGEPPGLGFSGETWESIPGARGCTPQSCSFRDRFHELLECNITPIGLSTNTPAHQHEFAQRTNLPFPLLSDSQLTLTSSLILPTFTFPVPACEQSTLLARAAFAVVRGRIHEVWYPVFPPDRNADIILQWQHGRPLTRACESAADRAFLTSSLLKHFHSTTITSRGATFAAGDLPAIIAYDRASDVPLGALTYSLTPEGCEVVTLTSEAPGRGVGAELLAAAESVALTAKAPRLFLTTTNDNLHALGFYQRRGWRLAALHRDEMMRARRLFPTIPLVGMNRIAMRDELELELPL
jgi:peroxiredoxin/GNAT superfamily N-acetyltransferase